MKYRDHKGSLSDSLDTVQEINSIDELKNHLNKSHNDFGKEVKEIKFEYMGFDKRINWETYYVLFILNNEAHFRVAGMSNGII